MSNIMDCSKKSGVELGLCLSENQSLQKEKKTLSLNGAITEETVREIGQQVLDTQTVIESHHWRQRLETWAIEGAVLLLTGGVIGIMLKVGQMRRRIYSCEQHIGAQGTTINRLGMSNGLGLIKNAFLNRQIGTFVDQAENAEALVADCVADTTQQTQLITMVQRAFDRMTGYIDGGGSSTQHLNTYLRNNPDILALPEG